MNVFITGGTRGIGQGLVQDFIKQGHTVVYTGTSEQSIQKSGHKNATGLICDVRDPKTVKSTLEKAVQLLGTIDLVVNNAGITHRSKHLDELSDEDISSVINVNVLGMMYVTKEAILIMKQQGYGTIYNMEGLGSNNMIFPKTVIYASSKHLLTFFTKGVQKELKTYQNIHVYTVSPGMVFTDLLRSSDGFEDDKISKILGSPVEDVTPYLVKKMIQKKPKIEYLSFPKILWRFINYPFRKKEKKQ